MTITAAAPGDSFCAAPGAQVTVNGAVAESGRDGALELSWTGNENTLRVPDVSLVEKAEGRVMMAFGGDKVMQLVIAAGGDLPPQVSVEQASHLDIIRN